jgi:hypothetical protein
MRTYRVRFLADGEGEEHLVNMLPLWDNQKLRIREAFGREMILDETRQSKDDELFVKSADGSPPDPTFERILTCTLGEDLTEHHVRVHKGETTRFVKDGLKRLHSGINPAKILFEGSEMDDADAVTEWATVTGSSTMKVKVTLDTPMQKFWLWQPSGVRDLGSEDLDGRSREEIWECIQIRHPDVRSFGEYRLYRGQDEVQWRDLPVLDVTLVPTNIPVVNRGLEFKIVEHTTVKRPREVGPRTQMSYQIFTIEKTQFSEPVEIFTPNEISLAQLVACFILPTGIQLDAGSVFYWNLREIEDQSASDKTKRMLEQIPYHIPPGFNLRVKCNTLHENSVKKMARSKFVSVPMCFAMAEDATIGRLKERVVDWMRQRGQGEDWTIEGNDLEVIDFNYEYQVNAIEREDPLRIFLRQAEIEVLPSTSWINLSDRLVREWQLPIGTLLRIYPATGSVGNRSEEDHSYTIDWEADKQYWFDIVYDEAKDRRDQSKLVRMVDLYGRLDTFVVPQTATTHQVADLWKRFMEVPADIGMDVKTGNGEEFYWGYLTAKDPVPHTFRAANFHGDVNIFQGSPQFEADQISRLLDIKMSPFKRCQLTPRARFGPVIQFDDETTPLGLKVLKQHLLAWNIEGRILRAPQVTTWWIPYNLEYIMRYGHSVNTDIPEDPNEAEFPPTPWPEEVIIRVKSQALPASPAAPLSVDGSPGPSAPDSPSGWKGPALGQAQPISTAASGLAEYTSPYSARTVEGQQEEPTDDEELQKGMKKCTN